MTEDRIGSPEEALNYTTISQMESKNKGWVREIVPTPVVTAIKDMREWRKRREFNARLPVEACWNEEPVVFVWQQHDLFPGPGYALARKLNVPFVSFVHAPQVWEAKRWGVNRPLWGGMIERYFEAPDLQRADVVACVSEEVREELHRFGVQDRKIVVTHTGVDAARFSPSTSGARIRERYNLTASFVFGWTGSFRKFHGLEIALRAFSRLYAVNSDARLLLVGDGLEKSSMQELAVQLHAEGGIIFTGAVSHLDIPEYIGAMDAAFVTARDDETFHYSPQKLREYMLCAKPVIVPTAGEMKRMLTDSVDSFHYAPGDEDQLLKALKRVISDRDAARAVGMTGYESIRNTATWDAQLERLLEKLDSVM